MTGVGFAPLVAAETALPTSVHFDGRGVGTPVGIAAGRASFVTLARAVKVGRIARNPRATLAAGDHHGVPIGPTRVGVAGRREGAAGDGGRRALAEGPWGPLRVPVARRRDGRSVGYEVPPVAPSVRSGGRPPDGRG